MLTQEIEVFRPEVSGCCGNIFVSVEMSRSKWVIGLHTPLADKIAHDTVTCGDADAVLALVERQRIKIGAAGNDAPP